MTDINKRLEVLQSDEWLQSELKKHDVDGVYISIQSPEHDIKINKTLSGDQFISEDTPINIKCIAKPIIAFTILKWALKNGIDIEQNLECYSELPENFKLAVNFRQLLSHTAGLPYTIDNISVSPDWKADPIAPPDTIYSYSSQGFVLASEAVSRIDGRPFLDIINETFKEEFGIQHNFAEIAVSEYDKIPFVKNNLLVSLNDLHRFMKLNLAGMLSGQPKSENEIIAALMRNTDHLPKYGNSIVKGMSWLHMTSGVLMHSGVDDAITVYSFFYPPAKLYGVLYYPKKNSFSTHIIAQLGLMGNADTIVETTNQLENIVPSNIEQRFSNGNYTVRIGSTGTNYRMTVEVSRTDGTIVSTHNIEGIRQIYRNLLFAQIKLDQQKVDFPRAGSNTGIEFLKLKNSTALRINDVYYYRAD